MKAVSFDLWFTLIWSDDNILEEYTSKRIEAIYTVLSKYGSKLSYEDVEKLYEYTAHFRMIIHPRKTIKYIIYGAGIDLDEDIIDKVWRAYEEATSHVKPYVNDQAFDALDYIKGLGYKIGIITNTSLSEEGIWRILRNINLSKYIDIVLSSATEEVKKPFPEIFNRLSIKLGINKHDILHVGDKYIDDYIGAYLSGLEAALYKGLWDKYRVYREFRNERLLNICPRECILLNDLRDIRKILDKYS